MGFNRENDPSAFVKVVGLCAQSGVAAGTGDNTEITTDGIDLMPVGLAGYRNCVLALGYLTSVAQNQTLAVTVKVSDSADNTNWSADTTLANAVQIEGSTAAATVAKKAAYELGVDVASKKKYVRFKITMNLSASGTDTFVYGAVAVLGAADKLPV
jgi:hypothetical protein